MFQYLACVYISANSRMRTTVVLRHQPETDSCSFSDIAKRRMIRLRVSRLVRIRVKETLRSYLYDYHYL